MCWMILWSVVLMVCGFAAILFLTNLIGGGK